MARLSVEDLINKKEECKQRKEIQYIDIHSKFLNGEIQFHSVDKDEILDFRDRFKTDKNKAMLYFIYMSSDDLRDRKLLKAYGRDKTEEYKIVEDLFTTDAEKEKVLEILMELNGMISSSPDEIYKKEIEKTKN